MYVAVAPPPPASPAAHPSLTAAPGYEGCGKKIKDDLLGGNAVVLFAYGLSGSGKTFTVFGPDAVDSPDAWFKHAEPHNMWGIFPRLAYELFQEKGDGWKITMKYFQNIVDTVRDLNSPTGEEQSYKTGMRKDQDGFMDVSYGLVASLTPPPPRSPRPLRSPRPEASSSPRGTTSARPS